MACTFVDVRHAGGSVVVSGSEFLEQPVVRLEVPGMNPLPLYPSEALALAHELQAYARAALRREQRGGGVRDAEASSEVVIQPPSARVIGLDGKTYPRPGSYDREAAIGHVHRLSHSGMSVRDVRIALAELGIERSVGSISADLNNWRCGACVQGVTNFAPEQKNALVDGQVGEGGNQNPGRNQS